ncbi:MAG: 50S ribosomal protein L23 [Oscillospiraceae bacterium]|jgi:large subunit ribosomal protein L23|nr:50S ribosomal protein L23 [Oscillospiraceae bacterium]
MSDVYDVIVKPIITEDSIKRLQEKKYTFEVARDANKIEISRAVAEIFGVKVKTVRTMNVRGRQKRVGRHVGFRSDWKKAIVTLTADSKGIEFFESLS